MAELAIAHALSKMFVIKRGPNLLSNVIKRYLSSANDSISLLQISNETDALPKKFLKIAILGLPNTGKSTLVNQLVKRPVCAASSKIHTTKVNAFAIYNEEDTQLVFIDTPGLSSKGDIRKFKLDKSFTEGVRNSLKEADIIGIMQDMQCLAARQSISTRVMNMVSFAKPNTPFILLLNKVDMLKEKKILFEVVENLTNNNKIEFKDIFMISALKKIGVDDLRNYFLDMAKEKPWAYEDGTYTDQTLSQIIERIVRAKLLDNVRDEVPYNLRLQVTHTEFDDANNLFAIVAIHPQRNRHNSLIIGPMGRRIRIVALQAEQELCNIFRTGVKLKLVPLYKAGQPNHKHY